MDLAKLLLSGGESVRDVLDFMLKADNYGLDLPFENVDDPSIRQAYIIGLVRVINYLIREKWSDIQPEVVYKEYLRSKEWYIKRALVLEFCGYKCQLCGSIIDGLAFNYSHIHHNSYVNLGFEPIEDLLALCIPCHDDYHDRKRQLKKHAKNVLSWIGRV